MRLDLWPRIHFSAFGVAMLMFGLSGHVSTQAQTGTGGKDGNIEKCERNLGTLAVAEPQSHVLSSLSQHKLGSPSTMLRMIAQESGCFTVVERGVGMQNIQQERALASGGMLQQDANLGGGQLQAADFVLTPSLQFSGGTGGLGAAVGGLLGRMGGTLGALGGLAGGVSFKEAETTLLLADVRSGIQVASAEGQASKMDFSLGGWGWGGYGWASAGGYSKTPEGKLLAASLLDNFNRIVQQVRNKTLLVQATSASSQVNAQLSTRATPLAQGMPVQTAVVVQPTTVMVAQSGYPPPASSYAGVFMKAAGSYTGRFAGQFSGTFTLQLSPDGKLNGWVHFENQPQFTMAGQINNTNGDFTLGGSTGPDNAMAMGRIDLNQFVMQGQWFLSKPTGGAPHANGSFAGKR
jgi:curli biogenesis system outer membrane secretion channel CsgG